MDQLLRLLAEDHSPEILAQITNILNEDPNELAIRSLLEVIPATDAEPLFPELLKRLTDLAARHRYLIPLLSDLVKELWNKIGDFSSAALLNSLIVATIDLVGFQEADRESSSEQLPSQEADGESSSDQLHSQEMDLRSFLICTLLRPELFEHCAKNDGIQIYLIKLYFEVILRFEVEGNLVEQWLSLVNFSSISPSALMVLLSLSVALVKAKPALAQYVLPVLLDLHENPRKFFSPTQLKSIQHTLKLQLVEITKSSVLPPEVIPFIDEALIELGVGKCAVISKSLSRRKQAAIAQSLREKQRKARAEDEEAMAKNEEYEEDDVSFIDPTCIPLPWIVEILLSTLGEASTTALQAATANWKPPSNANASSGANGSTAQRKAKSRDPRLAEMLAHEDSSQKQDSTSGKDSSEDVKMDIVEEAKSKEYEFLVGIFSRFLSQEQMAAKFGVRNEWTNMLTRLVTLLTASSTSSFAGIKDAFAKFVFENFRERSDLALFCLNHEWINDFQVIELNQTPKYPVLFSQFLTRLAAPAASSALSIDPKDKTFTKFLCEAPYIPDYESVLDLLKLYCQDAERMALGLYTLRQLNVERPNAKSIFLPLLLDFCFDEQEELRGGAITMVATSKVLCREGTVLESAIRKMAVYINATGEIHSEQIRLESELEIMGNFPSATNNNASDLLFSQNCDLYFELCTTNPALLQEIIPFYPNAGDYCKLLIRNRISILAEVENCRHELLGILGEFPSGCELLAVRIVLALRESPSILPIVYELVSTNKADGSLYIPLIECGILKGENFLPIYLPAICSLIDIQAKGKLSQEIIARLVDPKNELLTPLALLMYFHRTEESKIGLKRCMEGIQVCFTLLQTFTQPVFGQLLQRLMEESVKGQPLPILFMRTVIQSVSVYKSLQTMVIQILTKLSSRRIWEQPKLWEGWIRCCKILLPHSLPIILQLPLSSFKDLIGKAPDMSPFVGDYIRQQPTSLRNRLSAYAKLLK